MTDRKLVRMNSLGIVISSGSEELVAPLPSDTADQLAPRPYYVYAHFDCEGGIFYVGRGKGNRAWQRKRHELWHRYVEKHLGGVYSVRILADGLSESEAEWEESKWVTYYSDKLVNWDNMAAPFDSQGNEIANAKCDANRVLIQSGMSTEAHSLEDAVAIYVRAIDASDEYAFFQGRGGLVGRLLNERREEAGHNGERLALDRLVRCLIALGRAKEASDRAAAYFEKYRGDLNTTLGQSILSRLAKAAAQPRKR